MKATATIVVRGRVGRHELLPGPWLEGLADKLAVTAIAIAYKRDDDTIGHATQIGPARLSADGAAVHIDVEIAREDAELPPAPHTATLDRLDQIIGDRPLG